MTTIKEQAQYCITCDDCGEGGGLSQYPVEQRPAIRAEMSRLNAESAELSKQAPVTAAETANFAELCQKAHSPWHSAEDYHVGWGTE